MALRVSACKNVLAIAFVCAVGGSFVVENLRERECDLIRGYTGWPLLAVSQENKANGVLLDRDFTGEEDEATDIPAPPQKTWIVLGRPLTVRPLRFAVNLGVAVCVVLATIIMTIRWRRRRSTVSLLGIFLWITCVGILLADARMTEAEVVEAFWSFRSAVQFDWLDIVCFTFIAAGCTCAIYCAFRSFGAMALRSFGRTRPDGWQQQSKGG